MPRMRAAAIAVLVFLVAPRLAAAGQRVEWQPLDFAAAAARAQAERKLIYVFIEGDNCPPCDMFKETHLSDPAFIDFVNTVFTAIRVHDGDPAGQAFIDSLNLTHPARPRFYALSPEGRGLSMSIGIPAAPPMGPADTLGMVMGVDLPVDKARVAAMAARLRQHAASQKAKGAVYPNNPFRSLGVAILEAQAWALAGRLDEGERALGGEWAEHLADQEVRGWYVNFWLAWNRNPQGALAAARAFRDGNPDDPAGVFLLARALAANGDYAGAAREGAAALRHDPANQRLAETIRQWRKQAGM